MFADTPANALDSGLAGPLVQPPAINVGGQMVNKSFFTGGGWNQKMAAGTDGAAAEKGDLANAAGDVMDPSRDVNRAADDFNAAVMDVLTSTNDVMA